MKVSGVVESKARSGKSIKVNGEWYGDFNPITAEYRDTVEFDSTKSKCGKYNNIVKGSLKVISSAAARPASAGGGRPPFSNLGVELGHASKLAMDMAIASGDKIGGIGSAEFYKCWIADTEKVYKLMKGLRAKFEEEQQPSEEKAFAPPAKAPADDEEEDIFD